MRDTAKDVVNTRLGDPTRDFLFPGRGDGEGNCK